MRARVQRLGLPLVKGTRHVGLDEIELDTHGLEVTDPDGDVRWCWPGPSEATSSMPSPSRS